MPRVSKKYKEEKTEAILDAAAKCFAEKGYNETSVDDIAKASGTSKGSIYLYFKSKEEIFHRLNAKRTEKYFEIKKQLAGIDCATEKMKYIFRYFYQGDSSVISYDSIAVQFEFWIFTSKTEKQALFDERANDFARFIEEIITEGIQAEEFRSDVEVSTFSRLFWACLDGIFLHLLFHRSKERFEDMLYEYERMVLKYLKS
ncbi:TetR/AcrR family transcriptional regulator [Pseudalkalibacillus sp. SCS-8]|uniref:TetR/AcrR family transcriptional regulator n=1 Tax=Pseudalkalibacillus nanhaiensis TaxID=3115291 RepID=UPI0032DBAA5E